MVIVKKYKDASKRIFRALEDLLKRGVDYACSFKPLFVPMRYRQALELERLRSASLLTPWGCLTNITVVIVQFGAVHDVGSRSYHIELLTGVEVISLLLLGLSFLLYKILRSAESLSTARYYRIVLQGLTFLLGMTWASMPFTLFLHANADMRVVIACICAGLIATSIAFVSIRGVTAAMAMPIAISSGITLWRSGDLAFAWLGVALTIYTAFILVVSWQVRRLMDRFNLIRIQQKDQQETLQLFLGKTEKSVLSWIWETDEKGFLRFVSADLAAALHQDVSKIENQPMGEFLQRFAEKSSANEERLSQLQNCLDAAIVFRDVTIALQLDQQIQHWSIAGRPLFDEYARFYGFRGLASDITAELIAHERASFQARHDALTGLPNRYAFDEALRQALSELGRFAKPFAIFCIDLDHFKSLNDRYGHNVGDHLLRAAARRIAAVIGPDDILTRFGGDEFILLVNNLNIPQIENLANAMIGAFSAPFLVGEESILLSLSIGISLAPAAGDSVEALLNAADLALYQVKENGGCSWCFFEAAFRYQVEQRRNILRDLRTAITQKSLTLVYQPVVDAHTLSLRGFEALARWHRPGNGPVSPDKFIRLAEEAGLIKVLGAWILEEACLAAQRWPHSLFISVNVSCGQLYEPNFVQDVQAILSRTGLEPGRLELEITESIFMDAEGVSFGILRALTDIGVRIVLDDFGRGFSSLGFLKDFSFSKIKIDTGFTRDMMHDRRSAAIVRSVITLAGELGIVMTAEGVETNEQLTILQRYGCTQVQGYLFSVPLAEKDIKGLLMSLRQDGASAHKKTYMFEQR
ncbi:putative bifunctional diguanylate cyclase/phosphodiesterase [Kozakia baliensis]|nr:bifunctional diguanylate cyclase/phosphodiesterase [Kozakia baliensis]